ncbi:hydantoinase/oxoprolinase N-terminal domain-containing protein [Actinomarinicola tropica]|uniref:hydantoinase/oxoprolinase N-terminal domain-containing protein n=1 Tax=Actinomarinicola tropica TaxID=2789776 RepID=UPI001E3FD540|nr:hydantoinase/oxoprolinase N-terminal domain-containing protein [Actinomarinicola tropica]
MRVGSDTGGTFTDLVTDDGRIAKVPSERADPGAAVRAGLTTLGVDDPSLLAHGTTVATNALLERRGAPTVLVTSEGLADVIEIARQDRPSLYDPAVRRPEPLVPRHWRFEIPGRLDAEGREVRPIRTDALAALPEGAEAVAVVLLHADLDPRHEQAVATALAGRGVDVCCSHEVSPEMREYERTVTTVINASLRPLCRSYLSGLDEAARDVVVMTSAGGLMPAGEAAELPAALLLSGPAGGVRAGGGRPLSPTASTTPSRSTWVGRAPTCAWSSAGGRPRPPLGRSRGSRCASRRSTC